MLLVGLSRMSSGSGAPPRAMLALISRMYAASV